MKYNELEIKPKKLAKRVGRGISAGQGKTAGRGTKGQKSRTGYKKNPGFEGGQNPLMQALPKLPGFRSFKPKTITINLSQLEAIKSKEITGFTLFDAKLISDPYARIKLLADGELKTSKTVKLPEASQNAIDAVKKAGGSFEKVDRLTRQKKSDNKQ